MGVAQICEGQESPSNCIHLHNQEGMFWVPPIKMGVYQKEAFWVAGLPPREYSFAGAQLIPKVWSFIS